ncbi:MAG: alpha/beta hydrolase-fold protein [Bacteroidales bacterium]|nr:alpha/beta hydrolase-fold protein [Bacteroidales bacterium]
MNRMGIMALFVAVALATACGCSESHKLPDPPENFVRYTETVTLHSEILGTDINFGIYLPASYRDDKGARYPVVYMLHGLGDNWTSWNGKYLQANRKVDALVKNGLSEMIYVFPSGFKTYYCNFYTGKYNYMDMFVEELIPFIDKNFRTLADKGHRAVTGYSMGGFGAMALAMKHPELFCCSAPLSMSFRTDSQYMSESQDGWDEQWGRIFGGIGKYGPDRLTDWYLAHCPYYQFSDAARTELETVKWFLTCGDDEEQLLIANDSLHVILRDRNYAHEFRVGNGAHTSTYWMDALSEVLPWFDSCMNGSTLWPECSESNIVKADIEPDSNGVVESPAFSKGGTCVYFLHRGLSKNELRDVMAVAWNSNNTLNYVFLPCDLDIRSAAEWEEYYAEKYGSGNKIAVVLDGAGQEVLARKSSYGRILVVNTVLQEDGETVTTEGEKWYFAATDDASCYRSMGNLYRSCKRSGANFEYRVVNGSGDKAEDRLRTLSKIRGYIF